MLRIAVRVIVMPGWLFTPYDPAMMPTIKMKELPFIVVAVLGNDGECVGARRAMYAAYLSAVLLAPAVPRRKVGMRVYRFVERARED